MAGRYPKVADTSNVTQLPGTEQKDTLSEDDILKTTKDHMPSKLAKDERVVWRRLVPELIRENRFKPLYVDFLKEYCVVVARMERFLEYLDDPSVGWKYITEGRNGTQEKNRSEAGQYNDDWRKWNSLVNQLGLSPATDQKFHSLQPDLFGQDPYSG